MNRQPCTACDGYGYTTGYRPTCCGNVNKIGECRGHCAVPEPIQEQCTYCGGTGDGPGFSKSMDDRADQVHAEGEL